LESSENVSQLAAAQQQRQLQGKVDHLATYSSDIASLHRGRHVSQFLLALPLLCAGGVSLVQVKASTQPISDKASKIAVATQQQQQDIEVQAVGTSSRNNVVRFRRRLATPVDGDNSSSSSSAVVADAPAIAPTTTTSTTSSSSSSSSSGCPIMQALQPPLVKLSWWQRIWQITQPMKMQSMALDETVAAGGSLVQLEQQLAFEAAYVPGTGVAVRHILAGDSGSEPYTGPSLVPFFGE
jgi:hypothetical protein